MLKNTSLFETEAEKIQEKIYRLETIENKKEK